MWTPAMLLGIAAGLMEFGRHRVTIMFTGIRGIMQMSLNEEQMLSFITRFHKMMTSIVEQYEGTVGNMSSPLTGWESLGAFRGEILDEGLLVYFNAPRMAMNTLCQELVDDGWLDASGLVAARVLVP
eukprot:Skav228216  [mRNA]  locus=scaffold43:99050:100663:+ [translate_table: standard]